MPSEASRVLRSKRGVILLNEDESANIISVKRKSLISASQSQFDDDQTRGLDLKRMRLLPEEENGKTKVPQSPNNNVRMRLLLEECQAASGNVGEGKTKAPSGQHSGHDNRTLTDRINSGRYVGKGKATVPQGQRVSSHRNLTKSRGTHNGHSSSSQLTRSNRPASSLDGFPTGSAAYAPVPADSLGEYSTSADTHSPANSHDENSTSSDTHWRANYLDENITRSGLSDSSQECGSPAREVTTLRQWIHELEETSPHQDFRSKGIKCTNQGRGIATGEKLDKEVKKNGKYKISFLPGETVSTKNNSDLMGAIGVIVKGDAELQGVSSWKYVSDSNKKSCYTRLSKWFDIDNWTTDRVYNIIDKKFHVTYTRWRSALNRIYHTLLDEGINPRDVCPRKDLDMIRWHAACDFIEDDKFQKRSRTNKQNRKKARFSHTSGRIPMLCRYKDMKEKSKIELFKITHTNKDGEFVNPHAQATYEEMVKMQQQAQEAGEPISEEAIMRSTLGVRCGYVKGMGHGVDVTRVSESDCSELLGELVKENLSELINTKEKVTNVEEMINSLQVQMTRMEKCVRQIAGIPSCKSGVDDTENEDDRAESYDGYENKVNMELP